MGAGLSIFLGTRKGHSFQSDYTAQVGAEITAGENVNFEAQN